MKKKKYQQKNPNTSKNQPKTIKGIIKTNSRGIGYLRADLPAQQAGGFKEDIEIEPYFLKTAFNGDEVLVVPHPKKKGQRLQGEVVKILKRARDNFVGTLEQVGSNYFLKPDNRKVYKDIIINKEKTKGAGPEEKVLVKIISWGDPKKNPEGEVIKVLGKKGLHEVEMQSILLEKGVAVDFPPEVEKEAQKIAKEALAKFPKEISSRKDFRNTTTFTIDPVDAKDFDDAISIKEIRNSKSETLNKFKIQNSKFEIPTYEVGIHIADVSYYVREGSFLEKEASKRGFSTYLVDRTIPMLPEILSNDLCSLKPDEDRLAFSAVFKVNEKGKVIDRWFGRTVIRSSKRFSYEEAQKVLDEKKGQFFNELTVLNNIAENLRKERFKSGAIDFDSDEVRFELDSAGKPIKVWKKARLATHKLIEELMLMANREVAEFFYRKTNKKSTFIFRIHDLPDKEKIKSLSVFLRALGYNLSLDEHGGVSSRDLNALFAKIEGKAEESLIKTAAIRSMAKAVYSTKNIGHFGLAFRYYTHFTSPIRRYSDLLVHRFLEQALQGKISSEDLAKYHRVAMDLSEKEVRIAEAERDSIKYKQVEYMLPRIGQTFNGIISGITEWGMYVEEVETKAEGMIKLRDLGDDFWELDQKQYALIGQRTKRKFRLGDKVKVKVEKVDLDRKQIDYKLA